jgi:hypothetical protein
VHDRDRAVVLSCSSSGKVFGAHKTKSGFDLEEPTAMYQMAIFGIAVAGVVVLAVLIAAVTLFPDLLRYMKIRSM